MKLIKELLKMLETIIGIVVLAAIWVVGPEWDFRKLNIFRQHKDRGKINKNY
jgi:hypothetical protein